MNADQINSHYYGDPADPATERARERIHWICSQATGKDLLDIGCSQGIVCLLLAREGFRCTGVDLEPASLAVGQEALSKEDELVRARVTLKVADGSQLPFPDESFDLVILGEVLEHLVHPVKVLTEAKRVLRSNGRLVVTVPHGLNAFPDHKWTYYPVSLLQLLQPHFKTASIGTLGDYITYRGVKDPAYDPAQISKESLFDQYLNLEALLEKRCLAKERALLEKATDLYAQLKKLTAQSGTQASRIVELEKAFTVRNEQVEKLERNLEQSRAAAAESRAEAVRARTECSASAFRVRELQKALAVSGKRVRKLEGKLEQQRAATVELRESLVTAGANSRNEANRLKDLQENLAVRSEQIRALESALDQERSSIVGLCERAARAETESAAQANRAKDLSDALKLKEGRIRDLEASVEEVRASLALQAQHVLRAENEIQAGAARAKNLEEKLRKELREAESAQARLNAEAAMSRGTAEKLEHRVAALEAENRKLTQELETRAVATKEQLARIEALRNVQLREREKHEADLLRQLEADWKRRLANQRIRDVVRLAVPPKARVLVISKGDDDLLNLDGRSGLHFPQTEDGTYAGYHPANSAEAIKHLEALKLKGADFLLVPASSFWWMEYYQEFRTHLETHHQVVAYDEDCLVFALRPSVKTGKRFRVSVEGLGGNDLQAGAGGKSNGSANAKTAESARPPGNGSPPGTVPSATSSAGAVDAKSPEGRTSAAVIYPPQAARTSARSQSREAKVEVSSAARVAGSQQKQEPKPLVVGCILDEFTAACFRPECNLVTFRPDNWKATLERTPIDMLFVESAWHGNGGSWQYKIASFQRSMGEELVDVVSYCRARNIPTVFWNKEDPPHFNRFIHRAPLFDFVFTSDADMIAKYCAALKHDRVAALPFAAQLKLHHPIIETAREHNVCFAGAYYATDHDERRLDMDHLLRPALSFGLHIYDRQHGVVGANAKAYQFPEVYQPAIRGRLEYAEMVKAYKKYKVFLNVNSVKCSPTMFSRRVFELLASGTPVISSYSKGIVDLLGADIVHLANSEEQTRRHLENLLGDENYWAKVSLKGLRQVCSKHTYAQRFAEICRTLNLPFTSPLVPSILAVAEINTDEQLKRLVGTLQRQAYRKFKLLVVRTKALAEHKLQGLRGALPDIQVQSLVADTDVVKRIQRGSEDFVWVVDLNNYYGENFLNDAALVTMYSDADIIGKRTCYKFESGEPKLAINQAGEEFKLVNDVSPGSILARRGKLDPGLWKALIKKAPLDALGLRILSIDRFNYVERGGGVAGNGVKGGRHPFSSAVA